MGLEIEGMPVKKDHKGETAGQANAGAKEWISSIEEKSTSGNPTPEEVVSMRQEMMKIEENIASLQAKVDGIVARIQAGQKSNGRSELKEQLTKELTKEKLELAQEMQGLVSRRTQIGEKLKFIDDVFVPKEGKLPDTPFTFQ